MELSRKRQRELKKLRSSAEHLWDEQREVLEHANTVLRKARREVGHYARERMGPISGGYEKRVKPAVATGIAATRGAASATREKFTDEVLPAVSSAVGSALAVVQVAKDPRVRAAVRKAGAARVAKKKKKGLGAGSVVLIGLGVVAAAGVAYAAWQTLRADDELWIEHEAELEPETPSAPTEAL